MRMGQDNNSQITLSAPAKDGRVMRWFNVRGWSDLTIATPYVWLLFFFLIPFLIVVAMSFATRTPTSPPFSFGETGSLLDLRNFARLFQDDLYIRALITSVKNAAMATVLCLLVGYPMALALTRVSSSARNILLMLVILPFWTSFLLRVYAWKGILADQGVLNRLLVALGIVDEPIQMLYTNVSMLVGMTYVYLPFMVLPLYANLVKMDVRLLEAAHDLGASPLQAFWLVTVPLSKAGIVAGFMLVFIPAVGEFVIPSLLGGPENIMIGRVVWDEMFTSNNWPRATALAVVMIGLIVVPLAIYYRYTGDTTRQRAGDSA